MSRSARSQSGPINFRDTWHGGLKLDLDTDQVVTTFHSQNLPRTIPGLRISRNCRPSLTRYFSVNLDRLTFPLIQPIKGLPKVFKIQNGCHELKRCVVSSIKYKVEDCIHQV